MASNALLQQIANPQIYSPTQAYAEGRRNRLADASEQLKMDEAQNTIRARNALGGALGGSELAMSAPETYMKVQEYQQGQKEAIRKRQSQTVLGTLAPLRNLPPEQRAQAYAQARQRLAQQDPDFGDLPEDANQLDSILSAAYAHVNPEAAAKSVGEQLYPEQQKATDLQRNYAAAQGQGFKGSIFDYQRELAAAGRAPVQPQQPPSGYRAAQNGALEFIPGGPADPAAAKRAAPTEFQGKSAIYASRADQANKTLESLGDNYSPMVISAKEGASNIWGIGGMLGAAGNAALNPADQQAEQAQRDFINAVLRQESGAAIAPSEFDNARKQYFPQPGDSETVKAQKAANRRNVIEGLQNNAGQAAYDAPSANGASVKFVRGPDGKIKRAQ